MAIFHFDKLPESCERQARRKIKELEIILGPFNITIEKTVFFYYL